MINFKPVKISEIFNIETGRDVIISNTTTGDYPLISHQHDNNGITKYISKLSNRKLYNYKETIALADRGVFYATTQCKNFYIGTRVKALTFKEGEKSEKIRLFFVTVINKLQIFFKEYLNNATDKLPDLEIMLPYTKDDKVDYDYMDKYINSVKDKIISKIIYQNNLKIKKYMNVAKITEYSLNEKDINILNKYKNSKFKKYKFSELFMVKGNPQLNKDSFEFVKNSKKYPYFTRTILNNGIAGYVNYLDDDHLIKGKCIAVGMLQMRFFYMETDYYAGQFTKSIIPKFKIFDEDIAQYFISIMNKNSKIYQRVLVRKFEEEFNNTDILLPVTDLDTIDFYLIKNYIYVMKKKVVNRINETENFEIKKLINE